MPTSKDNFESVGWTFNAGTWVFGEDAGDFGYWNGGNARGEMTYVFQSSGQLALSLKNNHVRDTVEASIRDQTFLSLTSGRTATGIQYVNAGDVLKISENDHTIILITGWSFIPDDPDSFNSKYNIRITESIARTFEQARAHASRQFQMLRA